WAKSASVHAYVSRVLAHTLIAHVQARVIRIHAPMTCSRSHGSQQSNAAYADLRLCRTAWPRFNGPCGRSWRLSRGPVRSRPPPLCIGKEGRPLGATLSTGCSFATEATDVGPAASA